MGRNYFFYIAILLTVAITVGSLISLKNELQIGVQISDKILHAFGYFMLTISWLLAYGIKSALLKSTMLIAIAVFIYGIIIEILQGVLTDIRQADLYDVFANFTGIAVAIIFFSLVLKKN
ncbi:MAG: VanZ family protein [Lutibacter sp.]|nr:VanZ family protein [Lutibacter sp.]